VSLLCDNIPALTSVFLIQHRDNDELRTSNKVVYSGQRRALSRRTGRRITAAPHAWRFHACSAAVKRTVLSPSPCPRARCPFPFFSVRRLSLLLASLLFFHLEYSINLSRVLEEHAQDLFSVFLHVTTSSNVKQEAFPTSTFLALTSLPPRSLVIHSNVHNLSLLGLRSWYCARVLRSRVLVAHQLPGPATVRSAVVKSPPRCH
jgi:hypothetical protein